MQEEDKCKIVSAKDQDTRVRMGHIMLHDHECPMM